MTLAKIPAQLISAPQEYAMTSTSQNSAALRIFIGLYIAPACGEWVTVEPGTDASELHEIGQRIAAQHGTEEYGIFDTDSELGGIIGEATSFDVVCTLADVADELADNLDAFRLWLSNDHFSALETAGGPDAEGMIDAFREDYCGAFDSLEDWAAEYVADTCAEVLEGMGEMSRYFDYASFARDADLGGDIWTGRAGGQVHVFHNN